MGFPEKHHKPFKFYIGISSSVESLAEMLLDHVYLTVVDIGKAVY